VTQSRRHAGSSAVATLAAVIGSAAASWSLLRIGRSLPPAVRDPWARTNHAGSTVTLLEGPAWVGGAVAGAAAVAAVGAVTSRLAPGSAVRSAGTAAIVALSAGVLGALDDLVGGAADKGLKGHLRALARGEVTTGAVKIVGLGLTGLLGAALVDSRRPARPGGPGRLGGPARLGGPGRPGSAGVLSSLVGGAVVAGAANAVNLFDLRPGRALKVTVAAGLPLVGGVAAATAVGSSLGVVRDDLRASSMLGDTGANAAGALLGLALVERTGLVGRAVALVGLAALTLASERVSFTRVIEANPVLRRVDEWGRERR
jgi:UDP-N-acetylmuramyl pentapeptide phosphotransferase/UDP-N-acetylglucosamine-1-phosphate transferase